MNMKAIGIDIGTTSVCGVLLSAENGEVLKTVTKNSNAFMEGCADWEKIQNVDILISQAKEILSEWKDEETAVIGVTGQMHGIVYVDENGKAVSPLYTWQDQRGNLPYKDTTYAGYMGSFTGYGNVTDFYNRENGIRPKEAVSFCTIHDYLVMQLCGLSKPLIHETDSASFGTDVLCGATVTENYQIAGMYGRVPVAVAIGDNQASVFSTLADSRDVLLNIGTGSQVSVISDKKVVCDNIEARPYFGGKYLIVGAALCGGRAYSMLKDFYAEVLSCTGDVSEGAVYKMMGEMLKKRPFTTLVADTRFAGTRKDADASGSISGITTENFTPADLTRSILEGMIAELHSMYRNMGLETTGLVGSGNGIRKNDALIKAAEVKFGASMKIPMHLEEAACGAALYGLVSCGALKEEEVGKLIAYERRN